MEAVSEPAFVRTREQPDEPGFNDQLTITGTGHAVITGTRDWLSLNPPERWVGGVRIESGKPAWRWNEARREVVRI